MAAINRELDLETVKNVLSQHRQKIKSFGLSSLSLFGSTVKETATANSNLDFLVEFEETATFDNYMNLIFSKICLVNLSILLLKNR